MKDISKFSQTGTFTSIYKRRKLPERGPGLHRKWILCIFMSERIHLEHLVQYQLVQFRSQRFRKGRGYGYA